LFSNEIIDALIEEAVQQMKKYLTSNEQAKVLVEQNRVK